MLTHCCIIPAHSRFNRPWDLIGTLGWHLSPIALSEVFKQGVLREGNLVMKVPFGAGFVGGERHSVVVVDRSSFGALIWNDLTMKEGSYGQ